MTKRTQPKAPARSKPKQQKFRISVEGQEMLVEYTPSWMGDLGQFEFRSPHKPVRRIPVSQTGYRSHFAPMPDIVAEASPQEYARLVALAFIRRAPVPAIRTEGREQPTLFGLLDR